VSDLQAIFSRLLACEVVSVDTLGGGRNSQVYRLSCANAQTYTAKYYFRHNLDVRDRLEVEFSSLQFLQDNNIHVVPRPIIADREHGCAVYEFIDGNAMRSRDIMDKDIDSATEFLVQLDHIKTKERARRFPLASEACRSIADVAKNIKGRLQRFATLDTATENYQKLQEFLGKEFTPFFKEIEQWSISRCNQVGIDVTAGLVYSEMTLSPSDFGFHNALRRSNGQIVFLDFEYFGWDDPAKMISDFLLHPAMTLRVHLKRRFVHNIISHFRAHQFLPHRVEIVYPLFGLKWCLIFLNEFIPEHISRREFSSIDALDMKVLQIMQLSKAQDMLKRIMHEYTHFPYYD